MKRITIFAVALAVVAVIAFAVPTFAQGPMGGTPWGGYGMMGGRGGMTLAPHVTMPELRHSHAGVGGYGFAPNQAITPTVPFGMMGSRGFGFGPNQTITPTVPYGYGRGGMMGGFGYGYAPNAKPITLDQAVTNAQSYVASFNNADLKLVEVEEYAWNFYGVVQEKSTGNGAFQIIVDKYSGAVYPEMGPNRMWNIKYSPMANVMSGWFNQAAGKMTVTMDQARADAAQYLKTYLPNAAVEDKGDTFYGYYNFDVLQNGKTYGMLSVNGYTGAVWYHTWHGDFVATKELD